MPNMNGLDFCKQLIGMPFIIILVTAAADERTAVQAFNDNIIHKFILKDDPDFTTKINASIIESQHRYFQNLSEGIIKPLLVDHNCVLNKPAFIEFFYNLCKQHHIAEYYLYDASGSFLMLDADANSNWLVVKNATEMGDYYDMARDSKASATVLDYLKEGKMIPFFPRLQDLEKVKGADWEKYLYPAQRVVGADQAFFYAFIQNKPEFLSEQGKILSHNQYMSRVWPEV